VVSTIVGKNRLNIVVTTADIRRAHTVDISEADFNKLVGNFRLALTSPASGKPVDPRPAGQKLYDMLVKPIEGDLAGIKADTIVWSLDGSLRYLPMAALWDKEKGYLAERFANAVVTADAAIEK
jgi:CHAT domain-containing protein